MSAPIEKSLTLHYEGYWQCRQATDPDPSKDPRGASGYTYAVGAENDLDQIIRLQLDEIAQFDPSWYHAKDHAGRPLDYRESWPAPFYPETHALHGNTMDDNDPRKFGVFISSVTGSKGIRPATVDRINRQMTGGKIRLLPNDDALNGPRFELRNTITYYPSNESGIFMPIEPFEIQAESPTEDNQEPEILFRRKDPLDPKHPNKQIWQIGDAATYAQRCPTNFVDVSDEALAAVGIGSSDSATSSSAAYYQMRKEWLELELTKVESDLNRYPEAADGDGNSKTIRRDAIKNRLYAIHFFTGPVVGNRMETRPAMLAQWDFPIRGTNALVPDKAALGVRISTRRPWPVRFWMGGFDGDTMRGYLRGTLTLPVD